MRPDVRAVHIEDTPVDAAFPVEAHVQRVQGVVEQTFTRPASVSPVYRLPGPVALGHITPLRSAVEHPEHAVEQRAVLGPLPAAFLPRHQRLDPPPALVGELVPLAGFASCAMPRSTTTSPSSTSLPTHIIADFTPWRNLMCAERRAVHAPYSLSVKQNLGLAPVLGHCTRLVWLGGATAKHSVP